MIEKIVVTKKSGNKTYLLKDEEASIVATSEIDGAHVLPRDIQTFTEDLQQVLHRLRIGEKRNIQKRKQKRMQQPKSCMFNRIDVKIFRNAKTP